MSFHAVRVRAFSTLNGYFDHTFVLTIKRNKYRRERLEAELAGLRYEYFYGVDGRDLSPHEISKIYDDASAVSNCGRSLAPGEIATSVSHRLLYQRIVDEGYGKVLILEDDARLVNEEVFKIEPTLKELPDDWDLLYLGHQFYWGNLDAKMRVKVFLAYPLLNLLKLRRYDLSSVRNRYRRQYSRHLMVGGSFARTHCFAVRNDTAKQLVERQTPIQDQCDGALIRMCTSGMLRTYSSVTQIFVQDRSLPSSAWNLDA